MNQFLWLIRKTLSSTFRRKKSWIIYFGLPVVGVLVSMMLYGNTNSGELHVGIVNQDGEQAVTQDTIRFIEGLSKVKVSMVDESELKSEIAASKLDSGLVFEQGFAASVQAGKPEHLSVVSVKGAQVTAYVKSLVQSYVGNVAAIGNGTKGDKAAFDKLYAAYREQGFKLTSETLKDTSNMKDMTYQSIGFLISFMMFSAVGMSELILKEKENRTFLRLLSSPMSAKTYVFANVAVNMIVLLLQIVVTLFLMKNVFHVDSGIPAMQMVLALLLFALTAVCLSLLVVAFAKTSAAAGALENLIITPTCLLAGCFFPMDIMPDTVKKISNFLPQHWLLDTINKLQHGSSFGSLYLNMVILLAFAAAFGLIAIFRFGRNNDTRQFV